MTPLSAPWLAATLLTGWLAGGAANWAADVLPGRGTGESGAAKAGPLEHAGRARSHYLTLPWYPFRHGVCPHCGEHLPVRAPLLKAATIAVFALAWFLIPDPWSLAATCLYAASLPAVLVIDFEHRRVLNIMLAPAVVVALLVSLLPDYPASRQAFPGGATGFGVFLLLALIGRGKMGAGDVKLASSA